MTRAIKDAGPTRSCQICGHLNRRTLLPAIVVRPAVAEVIRRDHQSWDERGWICTDDLQRYRHRYLEEVLRAEKGELSELETEVIESLREHEVLAANPDVEFDAELDLGGRIADRVASFGGSWAFISAFGVVLFSWMIVNSFVLTTRPFDPYPYILLNLVLSCLAAIQAPVIMMSQNRQEHRDRQRAMNDYQINLKAELEIRHLHQKMDHLLSNQWERLVEIQSIQLELINEIRTRP